MDPPVGVQDYPGSCLLLFFLVCKQFSSFQENMPDDITERMDIIRRSAEESILNELIYN